MGIKNRLNLQRELSISVQFYVRSHIDLILQYEAKFVDAEKQINNFSGTKPYFKL